MLVALLFYLLAFGNSARPTRKKSLTVLVTGGSSGIGRSTALEFAADSKFKVWVTMRSTDKWDLPPQENIVVSNMDVTSQDSVDNLVNKMIAAEGKIDIVINNAGYGVAGCLETVSIEEAKELFEVNVWGVVRVLQAVLPYMRTQASGGHLIQISSTSGIRGMPCMEYYTGSKFALEGITDSMRYSLAPFNISVTNINAGPVRTSFTDRFGNSAKGGRGTRVLMNSTSIGARYLQALTQRMISSLNARMQIDQGGQSSDELARLIVNVATLKLKTKRLTDVPFNIGSTFNSQQILQEVRKLPTGWGGLYNEILQSVPPLQIAAPAEDITPLREEEL